jgi:hypothetical protein
MQPAPSACGHGAQGEKTLPEEARPLRIASYLIQKGLISLEQAQTVIRQQEANQGDRQRFGDIAVRLGFISADALNRAIEERQGKTLN